MNSFRYWRTVGMTNTLLFEDELRSIHNESIEFHHPTVKLSPYILNLYCDVNSSQNQILIKRICVNVIQDYYEYVI